MKEKGALINSYWDEQRILILRDAVKVIWMRIRPTEWPVMAIRWKFQSAIHPRQIWYQFTDSGCTEGLVDLSGRRL